jgi:hypothetical protein
VLRADDAHLFIAGLTAWMLEGLDDNGKARALDDLRTTIGKHETRNGVVFASAAWLITTALSDRPAGPFRQTRSHGLAAAWAAPSSHRGGIT